MLQRAEAALGEGRSVLLDATFLQRKHRQWARRLAERAGARFLCLQVRAHEAAVRRRLQKRDQQGTDPSDARWEIYLAQKRSQEPPQELPREELLVLDSEQPAEALIERVRGSLQPL
jgi:predicted kinase